MSGLAFASVLTLVVVPVLYSIFFKVKYRDEVQNGYKGFGSRQIP